jgi:cyanobactin maturation PatA/PatG family protease
VPDAWIGGSMSRHGTHVTSLIFGQPGSPVAGIAPGCRGLILPIFQDYHEGRLSQLDLARSIELAVQEGAHIINISGGERTVGPQASDLLARAIRYCERNNVLVVAAVGNDGCECLHVPAALPGVLAVGALGANGQPLGISNWGRAYRTNGILAPGENIRGAVPGGVASFSGSSFAAPIVSGVAAVLLSIQGQSGRKLDPRAIGDAILSSAVPCNPHKTPDCPRHLAGTLNILGAYTLVKRGGKKTMSISDAGATVRMDDPSLVPIDTSTLATSPAGVVPAGVEPSAGSLPEAPPAPPTAMPAPAAATAHSGGVGVGVVPAGGCGCGGGKVSNVFALGLVSFDFGTEARRDSFRQLMPAVAGVPANPYDPTQLCDYLDKNPWESTKVTWTLNLDATPLYAIEPETAYAEDYYKQLRKALRGESRPQADPEYVGRVSLTGVLTSRTVQLFSGQTVPVVVAQLRGFYMWNESALFAAVKKSLGPLPAGVNPATVDVYLRSFLSKVYYEFRNLGQNPSDRALNYSATNLFQLGSALPGIINPQAFIPNIAAGTLYAFDSISVSKSPYCRVDSDCWDVQLTFFNPDNANSANLIVQWTVDVSDTMPVTVGPLRSWTASP